MVCLVATQVAVFVVVQNSIHTTEQNRSRVRVQFSALSPQALALRYLRYFQEAHRRETKTKTTELLHNASKTSQSLVNYSFILSYIYYFVKSFHDGGLCIIDGMKTVKNLKEVIAEAREKKIAIGHFNISNIEGLWGIFRAAQAQNMPVIIGVSEGERDFVGVRQAVALVKSIREEFDYPIYINADHSYSFDRVKEAIDAGFDAAIFDGAKLPIEENIKITKQCVDYAREAGTGVLIEAELGYIGTSSKLLDEIPEGVSLEQLTTIEDAIRFVTETGVDFFAPSIGNIHGMLKNVSNPKLNIERVNEISEATGVPLVLHGGSGIVDEDFTKAIEAGISIVHTNTEIRVAYRDAVKKSFDEKPDEVAPYRLMKPVVDAVQKKVEERVRLFGRLS